MQLRQVIVNGKAHVVSAQANAFIERYCTKRAQSEPKALPKAKVRSMLNTAVAKPAPVKIDGVVMKLYKRCKAGKHETCEGSFGGHSVCTCECHPR